MREEEILRQIKRNERVIERARKAKEEIDRTIRESERRTEEALNFLRRAGYYLH
ncbi:MAG: hypothetical protein M3335_10035 [Actinomycetota bacterium]|nr:hypothetical protein [Actinomycetota bacterium]